MALSVNHALSADGCREGSVRCGDKCTGTGIGVGAYCHCGEFGEEFNFIDDTRWCCNASKCEKDRNDGVVCKEGTIIPLTTPCNGECNTGRSYLNAREYWGCESKDQCIKIQYVEDGVQHCWDRSDERKINQDLYSPIQWDKLTTCFTNVPGYRKIQGVKCSGQGLESDCLVYFRWCNGDVVMKCRELGGFTTVHSEVCSNNTHWLQQPCTYLDYEGRRCTSENSGQCYYPDDEAGLGKTCRDKSHDILPLPKNGSCPSTYFSCLVDKKESCVSEHLRCDIHPQGQSPEYCTQSLFLLIGTYLNMSHCHVLWFLCLNNAKNMKNLII